MHKNFFVSLYFYAIFCISITLSACLQGTGETQEKNNERLILWGEVENQCSVWTITPATQIVHTTTLPLEDCSLIYAQTDESEVILHVEADSKWITIYEIGTDELLSEASVVETADIEVVSRPQLSMDGLIYFAGIQNGQQQLFSTDIQGGMLKQLNRKMSGIPVGPLLSPDGRYLAYEVELDSTNETECTPYCGGLYQIYDTVTEEEWALTVEPPEPLPQTVCGHGWLEWSPTSERFAISEVCAGFETIRIFDVTNRQPSGKIIDDTSFGLTFYGWIDDNRLLYNKVEYPSFDGITLDGGTGQFEVPVRRTFIYLLSEGGSQPLPNLPLIDNGGRPFTLEGIDWTGEGSYFAGTVAGGEGSGSDLVILEIDDSQHVNTLKQYVETNPRGYRAQRFRRIVDPAWSESGEWIAFSEWNLQEHRTESLQFIELTGERIFSFKFPEGLIEYEFVWLKS